MLWKNCLEKRLGKIDVICCDGAQNLIISPANETENQPSVAWHVLRRRNGEQIRSHVGLNNTITAFFRSERCSEIVKMELYVSLVFYEGKINALGHAAAARNDRLSLITEDKYSKI